MKPFNLLLAIFMLLKSAAFCQSNVLVLQTDFGLKDGAVSAMKGVAVGVSPDLKIFDLTHEIPAYNIWEAAYRLQQTAGYWPKGTVFVSVVDPGVGSDRKSVVLKTKSGHYFVTPDNGTLTLIAESLGIEALREIDETRNRLPGSSASYTFHGRDVYAYTGARLAAGVIPFDSVGRQLDDVVRIPYQQAVSKGGTVYGNIPVIDIQYGNVWTNIDEKTLKTLGLKFGDKVNVRIIKDNIVLFNGGMPFAATFASVPEGALLAYQNSLMNLSFAINLGDFAGQYNISSGPEWTVEVTKIP